MFLPEQSFSISGLLFFTVLRISREAEFRLNLSGWSMGEGATQAQIIRGQHPPLQMSWESSHIVAWRVMSLQHVRETCGTEHWWQVTTGHLSEMLVSSPGTSDHQESWLLEGCLDLVSELPGRKHHLRNRYGLLAGETSARIISHYSWATGHDIRCVFSSNSGTTCQQKLLPSALQIYGVDTVTFPFSDRSFHWEVNIGATQVGSCCKEFEDILPFHLQDIRGSGHCGSFPLRTETEGNTVWIPLWVVQKKPTFLN